MIGLSVNRIPRLSAFGMTHPGLVRFNNEDSLLVRPGYGIFAVADGMGGAAAGEVASAIFVERVQDILDRPVKSQAEGIELAKEVFISANQAIVDHVERYSQHKGMGCTAELLIFCSDGYVLGHVGDSRTYLFRDNRLKRLTRDHTLVQEQMDQGLLSTDEAARHPMRNVILRAVGVSEILSVDIIRARYQAKDIFLLCSDGLTDMVSDIQLEGVLSDVGHPEDKARQLVDMANAAGGRDNITVVVSEVL